MEVEHFMQTTMPAILHLKICKEPSITARTITLELKGGSGLMLYFQAIDNIIIYWWSKSIYNAPI